MDEGEVEEEVEECEVGDDGKKRESNRTIYIGSLFIELHTLGGFSAPWQATRDGKAEQRRICDSAET